MSSNSFSRGRGRRDEPTRHLVTTKLFVGNLSPDISSDELREMFEKFGEVTECDIVNDYAFVHFASADEADTAVENINQTEVKGSVIRVQKSTSSVRQKAGMGRSTDCYKCGGRGHWSKDCPTERSGESYWRGSQNSSSAYEDPYGGGDPFTDPYYHEHCRRTIARLMDRVRYLEEMLDRYLPPMDYYSKDPYSRPAPEYYQRRGTEYDRDSTLTDRALMPTASTATDSMRPSVGKMASYMSDSPPRNRARPY